MNAVCLIPARYASTRLPGKPLADIAGKPLIQRVYERARQARIPAAVIVATDDQRVYDAVTAFGGQAVLTSPDHATGTDRLAEAARSLDADVIVNVQGDEPLIPPAVIDQLIWTMHLEPALVMATAKCPMEEDEYDDPAAVKVVTDQQGYALYFSRSLLPYPRVRRPDYQVYKHIGIYAYRRDFLLRFAALSPTPLEQAESLEQLRALEHGYRIKVIATDYRPVGVDTPADLERVRKIVSANP